MPQVNLSWRDVNTGANEEDEHRVYRSDTPLDENSLPAPLATIAANTTFYVDDTVIAGRTYYYGVAAIKDSEIALATTAAITIENSEQNTEVVTDESGTPLTDENDEEITT